MNPRGPKPSLATVMAEYGAAVGRAAALYERDPCERQDLIQEIWVALWKALPAFRGDSSLRTYIYRIVHNCGVTHVGRQVRRDLPIGNLPEEPDPRPSPARDAANRQDVHRLERAIQCLPVRDRQLVGLKLEGLTNREISQASGLTENNVAVRLSRARAKLQRLMEETK